MNTLSRRKSARSMLSALLVTALLPLTILTGGCQPVREDRSIHWSAEGKSVGFQHGPEGVFLADPDGGKLTRIFQPAPDVLATSTPLWAPQGQHVLCTTAPQKASAGLVLGQLLPLDLPAVPASHSMRGLAASLAWES